MKNQATRLCRPALLAPILLMSVVACGGGGGSDSPAAASASTTNGAASGTSVAGLSGAAARTAAECLATASLQAGYVLTRRMRASDGSEQMLRFTTLGPASRAGVTATKVQIDDLTTSTPAPTMLYRLLSGGELYDLGATVSEYLNGVATTIDMDYSPRLAEGFTLQVGQSIAPATMSTNLVVSQPGNSPQRSTLTSLVSVSFKGFETITVPAGTFANSCRIEATTTINGQATVLTTWYANQYGFVVQTRDGTGATSMLVGVSINNQLLAGSLAGSSSSGGTTNTGSGLSGNLKR